MAIMAAGSGVASCAWLLDPTRGEAEQHDERERQGEDEPMHSKPPVSS